MVKFLLCIGAAGVILALGMIPSSQASPLEFEPAAALKDIAQGRIVGGNSTTIEKVPWQCSLQYLGRHYCAGSIINSCWILTAAHCVEGFDADEIDILCGQTYLSTVENSTQTRNVVQAIMHPEKKYYSTMENDVAILKLEKCLNLTKDSVWPIRMASVDVSPDTPAQVSGWGTTSSGGPTSDQLLTATTPIVSDANCTAAYQTAFYPDSMICAGQNATTDSCQGDSGGCLYSYDSTSDSFLQYGVVSWGYGCAQPNYPGVYARVSALLSWILRTVDCAEKADISIASNETWYQWYNLTYTP